VIFENTASDLVPGFADGNDGAAADVYLRDSTWGTTALISVNATGTASGNDDSAQRPLISADGRYVAFSSFATDLVADFVAGNGAGASDLFVRDLSTGTTSLISVNASGPQGRNAGVGPGHSGRQRAERCEGAGSRASRRTVGVDF
jgi:Tol biopolymer transport system component